MEVLIIHFVWLHCACWLFMSSQMLEPFVLSKVEKMVLLKDLVVLEDLR